MADYEDMTFEVKGMGRRGDARIVLPGGKSCFVSGCPSSVGKGSQIQITSHREGGGSADFARYLGMGGASSRPSQAVPASGVEVYLLHIGPTRRGDDCAIAICGNDVLDMPAYDGLVHLVRHHDDKSIFGESTDRRIAGGLYETLKRAEAEHAVEELIFTLGDNAITPGEKRPLRSYFRLQERGKYRASAVVKEGGKKPAAAAVAAAPVSASSGPKVHRATATAARKGSPG